MDAVLVLLRLEEVSFVFFKRFGDAAQGQRIELARVGCFDGQCVRTNLRSAAARPVTVCTVVFAILKLKTSYAIRNYYQLSISPDASEIETDTHRQI